MSICFGVNVSGAGGCSGVGAALGDRGEQHQVGGQVVEQPVGAPLHQGRVPGALDGHQLQDLEGLGEQLVTALHLAHGPAHGGLGGAVLDGVAVQAG